MKRTYKDPRVEKMVKPLRDADRSANTRFSEAIAPHRVEVKRKHEDAVLLKELFLRCGLVGVDAKRDVVSFPLHNRTFKVKVL